MRNDANGIAGKTVLVTGASSGIGRATARLFASRGCNVALAARRADALSALASELGPAAFPLPTDLERGAEIERMVEETVKRFGAVDVLVANAGVFVPGDFAAGAMADFMRMLSVNFEAVLRCIHAVIPTMAGRKSGDIVVTGSISGYIDIAGEPVYSATKHAVTGLVHTLRRQLAGKGIRVGSVSPGIVLNDMWGISDPAEVDRRVAERSGLRCEDVARAILYVVSEPPHVTVRDLVILPQGQDI